MASDAPASGEFLVTPFNEPGWDARVRGFHCGDEVDIYAIVSQRFVVFVDTSATTEQAASARAALAPELASRQALVIITHAHYDHAWGTAAFAGPDGVLTTPIIGHAHAREWMMGAGAADELARRRTESARFAAVRLIPPSLAYTESLTIDGGDLTLELLHTPGHNPDHTAIWIPESRIVLAGDAAEFPFPQVYEAADLPTLRRSLARLQALDPTWVLPCHGSVFAPRLLADNLAFFDGVERRVRAALATGNIPDSLADVADDDLERLAGYSYAEALAGVGAPEASTPPLYHQFFHSALRSTIGWLRVS
jgi:glyoxylase-like metal-dependent hydrolase (beta-lactamase superfamily II)